MIKIKKLQLETFATIQLFNMLGHDMTKLRKNSFGLRGDSRGPISSDLGFRNTRKNA